MDVLIFLSSFPLQTTGGQRLLGAWLLHSGKASWKARSSTPRRVGPYEAPPDLEWPETTTTAARTPSFGHAADIPFPWEGCGARNKIKIQMLQQKMGFQVESIKGQVFVRSRSPEPNMDWWHFKAPLMIHTANKLQKAAGAGARQRTKHNCFLVNRVIWKVFVPSCQKHKQCHVYF